MNENESKDAGAPEPTAPPKPDERGALRCQIAQAVFYAEHEAAMNERAGFGPKEEITTIDQIERLVAATTAAFSELDIAARTDPEADAKVARIAMLACRIDEYMLALRVFDQRRMLRGFVDEMTKRGVHVEVVSR